MRCYEVAQQYYQRHPLEQQEANWGIRALDQPGQGGKGDNIIMARYLRRVVVTSSALLVFTAVCNANLGIISQFAQQNNNHWIGPLSIGLLFLGSGSGAIYNKYIGRYPYNRIIFTGALGWDVYCAFSVMFLFIGFQDFINVIIIIGSLLCGLAVSLFYNGVFNYINECGKRDKRTKMYFGLCICINQSATLLGNGLSAVLIQPLGQKLYSVFMLGIGVLSSMSMIFVKDFEPIASEKKTLIDGPNAAIQQERESKEEKESSDVEAEAGETEPNPLIEEAEGAVDKKLPLSLFFIFSMSGVIISFLFIKFSMLFYQHFQDLQKEELNHMTFVAFMIEGCGQFTGGFVIALFAKQIKNIALAYTLNGLLFLSTVALLYVGFQSKQISLIYAFSFFLGFSDCFCFSMAGSIGGNWLHSGISLFNAGQSLTVAALSVLTIFFDLPILACAYSLVFVMSTVSLWVNRKAIGEIHLEHQ